MQVSASIALTPELWERTRKNEINRSRVCRMALEQECERIEKIGGTRRQAMQPPTTTPIKEGEEFVIG